jgi:putative sterol carrier protein
MARFLSPAWAEELNAALAREPGARPDPEGGLATLDGTFTVVQEVRGAPDGDVRVVLSVNDGLMRLSVEGDADSAGEEAARDPDVTIAISYDDAAALSKGELTPAEALIAGRIRVRGDLSVLVASQQILAAAHAGAGDLLSPTTY